MEAMRAAIVNADQRTEARADDGLRRVKIESGFAKKKTLIAAEQGSSQHRPPSYAMA
jgi:hypothetical protein